MVDFFFGGPRPGAGTGPVVTLNEGSTPLIEAPRLSERIGARAWLKFEGLNPTGSFKERGASLLISRLAAREIESFLDADARRRDRAGRHGEKNAERDQRAGDEQELPVISADAIEKRAHPLRHRIHGLPPARCAPLRSGGAAASAAT